MTSLPVPYQHIPSAVEGWLELGVPREAESELDRLPQSLHDEAAVLRARYAICAHRGDWHSAYEVAERQVRLHPDDASGWIHRSFAERRRPGGSLTEAFQLLKSAVERFPGEAVIPYNLACYCAQQAELDQAWDWLQLASRVGGTEFIRRMALADADLCALWPRIAGGP